MKCIENDKMKHLPSKMTTCLLNCNILIQQNLYRLPFSKNWCWTISDLFEIYNYELANLNNYHLKYLNNLIIFNAVEDCIYVKTISRESPSPPSAVDKEKFWDRFLFNNNECFLLIRELCLSRSGNRQNSLLMIQIDLFFIINVWRWFCSKSLIVIF